MSDNSYANWGTRKLDDGDYSGTASTGQVVWSATTNDILTPVHLSVSHSQAGILKVYFGSAATGHYLVNAHFGANQGIIREFMPDVGKRSPIPGDSLKVETTGGGVVLCHVEGFRGRRQEQ